MSLDQVLSHIDDDQDAALDRLMELLRIQSISTDSAFAQHCDAAADWLVDDLTTLGFTASKRDTLGHPMVVAHSEGSGKHAMFYGHYDVQPIDPIELWTTPPFKPKLEETPNGMVIRGRGASDDKGQLMTFLEACRAWKAVTGSLPIKISVLLEGEEESGSPSLIPFMEANKEELKSDITLICDTGMIASNTPSIVTMLRGLVGQQVTITSATKDLHSGFFGGLACIPIRVLNNALAKLHDNDGRITLDGFYDGVKELPESVAKQWNNIDWSEERFLGDVKLSVPAGEAGRSGLEQIWSRPSCDVNGIWGGYTGEGSKTVIPSQAHAKVSFRLVPGQDPLKIRALFQTHMRAQLPADCTIDFIDYGAAPAASMEINNPAFELARKALTDEWKTEGVYVGCGGSIPIAGHFQEIIGVQSMLIGFGQDDDQIHSPNEKYDLRSFHKGIRSWARIIHALAD